MPSDHLSQKKSALEIPADVGVFQAIKGQKGIRISQAAPLFLQYAQYDQSLSLQTVRKYRECLGWVVRDLDDTAADAITLGHVTMMKQKIITRGAGDRRVYSMVFALRNLLKYCAEILELPAMD